MASRTAGAFRQRSTYDQTGYDGHVVVNVWSEEQPGQTLRLVGGYPSSETGLPTESITPRQVAECIRAALTAGWNPAAHSRTFSLPLPRTNPT